MHSPALELCTSCPSLEFYRGVLSGAPIRVCPEVVGGLESARTRYLEATSRGRVYGFSTGVGALQSLEISHADEAGLRLIVLSEWPPF